MGLLDKIFRPNPPTPSAETPHRTESPSPEVAFGRYSDGNKSPEQLAAWNSSVAAFDREDFMTAFDHFFRYLKDKKTQNVHIERLTGRIHFVIQQGSNRVSGFANERWLRAEAKLAKADALNVGFMRRLLEQNFALKYGRYAIDGEENIVLIFDSYTLDCSPYKLYYALKEIALLADKQDDLLLDEFKMLRSATPDALLREELSAAEKELKYQYITAQIKQTFEQIQALNAETQAAAIAYLLLYLCYKLDYLIKPEGVMMETLERIHRTFFTNDGKTHLQKNATVVKEFEQLTARSKEDFFKEMYRTKATFGVTNTTTHEQLIAFLEGELKNVNWYQENHYEHVALAITGYAVAFSLFNYALPMPDRDLLHYYFEVLESDFLTSLGYPLSHADLSAPKLIKEHLKNLTAAHAAKHPDFKPNTELLRFETKAYFAQSFLLMMTNIKM